MTFRLAKSKCRLMACAREATDSTRVGTSDSSHSAATSSSAQQRDKIAVHPRGMCLTVLNAPILINNPGCLLRMRIVHVDFKVCFLAHHLTLFELCLIHVTVRVGSNEKYKKS